MSNSSPVLQWRRVVVVSIGPGTGGRGITIGDAAVSDPALRVTFEITKTVGRVPNTALLKIYNLAPDNEAKVKDEFDDVIISAGYIGDVRLVFRGSIRHVSAYRAGLNRILEIDAADGDKDFRSAIVNVSFSSGTTTSQIINHLAGTMKSTKLGHVTIADQALLRGRVLSGMTRDHLDDVAADGSANWSIQDGVLQIVPVDSTLPTEAIVIRSDTGMLNAPELSNTGVKVTCFMNPRLAVNGKIWIDNNDLKLKIAKQRAAKPGAKTHKAKGPKQIARTDPDGIYKVIKLVHKGDNRGNDWKSEVECLALGKAIPAGRKAA